MGRKEQSGPGNYISYTKWSVLLEESKTHHSYFLPHLYPPRKLYNFLTKQIPAGFKS